MEHHSTKINILDKLKTKVNSSNDNINKDYSGIVLADKYHVLSKLNVVSGEADLYKCLNNEGKEFVAKFYYRHNAIKPEIIDKLQKINCPNIAKVEYVGIYDDTTFVIIPFYKNGSLAEAVLAKGLTFDLDDIKQFVLPSLNNGLKVLHDNGIIHKDLKPSNIMISDDGTNLVIIDFGISSDTNGSTVVVTKTGMTPTYLAPEALSNTYLKETDYYALGITLYELFTGHTPYENLNEDQIASYASIQKIPYPIIFPKLLKNLINGLTYKDLSNRNDKNNPNRRWTFNEVKQWLDTDGNFILESTNSSNENDNLNSSIDNSNSSSTKQNFSYIYNLQEYRDINYLAKQLLMKSEEGIKELGRGNLSKKLRQTGEERLARICEDAESKMPDCQNKNETEKLFITLVYTIAPNLNKIVWNGFSFSGLEDYGNALIDEVNNNNCKNTELINTAEIWLRNGFLNIWAQKLNHEKLADSYVQIIETNKKLLDINKLAPKYNALRLGYSITGKNDFVKYQSIKSLEQGLVHPTFAVSIDAGNIVKFGNYFKNNDVAKGPIEWRVLKVSNNKALLITKDAIDCKPYNEKYVNITWEECTLRQWLNNEFINDAFNKDEQNKILVTNLSNPDNSRWRTKCENSTKDKIFLLSIDEANKYFKNAKDRECKPTSYAKQQGAWTTNYTNHQGNCYWWLRSPGNHLNCVAGVNSNGDIHDNGNYVLDGSNAIRPALFINL